MEAHKQMVLPVGLKGSNYLIWARTTKTVLRSRGLWKYVEPQEEAITIGMAGEGEGIEEEKKIQEDQYVLAVLQSSLEPSILAAYSYSETAKELWDTLKGVYGNLSNISRIFEVKKALNDLQQEEKTFKDIFGEFRGLWAELEMLRPPTMDVKELGERREQDQVFGLLLTLNDSFKGLIHHILRFEKLPTLNEVCMMIQKEEGSRGLFQKPSDLAHVVRKSQGDRRVLECEHCKMKGHTKEKCWTLYPHLMPMRLRGSGKGMRNFAGTANTCEDEVVRRSDLEALIKSITKLSGSGKSFLASKSQKKLIIDSGASNHMISDARMLRNVKSHNGKVIIANGKNVNIEGIGDLELFKGKTKALYVPEFTSNLLSVNKATKDFDCLAIFGSDFVKFQDNKSREVIGEGGVEGGLYLLNNEGGHESKSCAFGAVGTSPLWHARLGHPRTKILQLVLPNHKESVEECESCILGKHCRKMFPESNSLYNECFDLVHSDVWTAPCDSRDQYKYFVSFIDEKSKYTWVTLMSSKNQVLESFSNFYNYVLTQFGVKIKVLRSDNGGEYMGGQFKEFVSKHGIIHQTSCAYTPQQNGVSERKNRHLMEVARTIMFERGVPKRFWGDAVITACYLINRLPTKGLENKSPYEVLNKIKPSIDHLRVFGCRCYVFTPEARRDKLEPKSLKCMFLGYSSTQKGYKCYHPETRRVHVSRDVKFDEQEGYFNEKKWESLGDMVNSSLETQAILRSIPTLVEETHGENHIPHHGESEEEKSDDVVSNDINEAPAPNNEPSYTNGDGELAENEESGNQELISPPAPVLRRSTRQRNPPENWVKTRVYYNNAAMDHQAHTTADHGLSSTEMGECSECTAGFDPVPIGNSTLPSLCGTNTSRENDSSTINYPIEAYCTMAFLPMEDQVYFSIIDKSKIPNSYEEACREEIWIKAMDEELDSMERNDTWYMTELPKGKKTVGCRWVYTIKYKSTGDIERYKARLVAKGYTQVYGEDYTETFAPVAKLHSVRVLLSIAINLSWELWQMDVKNAFLQGELDEEVYMVPPQGYCSNSNKVCKLKKAIYGLKQSPRAWYQRLSCCLMEKGFVRSEADHSLFTKKGRDGIVAVLVYVDDIIITGNDVKGVGETKLLLKAEFDIKDLGALKYFLGIEMTRTKEGMFISQRKYTLDILQETGKLGSRPAKTPIEEGYQDQGKGEAWPDIKRYQRLVGKLIYLTITRPDICFAVNRVSQHMQAPTTNHWGMVERILRYLKGSPGKGIWMGCNGSTELRGYCDADWAGDKMDRKSTTGYCTFVGGNLVTWRSKKQKVVSLSSAEAEYRAMKDVTKELIWLTALLKDLGVEATSPIILHCDNQAAIHIASNPVFHERTKHIEIDCHFVRGKIQDGIISPMFIKSEDQVADVFTKATTSSVCEYIHDKIGLKDLHQPILRGSVELNTNSQENDQGMANSRNEQLRINICEGVELQDQLTIKEKEEKEAVGNELRRTKSEPRANQVEKGKQVEAWDC